MSMDYYLCRQLPTDEHLSCSQSFSIPSNAIYTWHSIHRNFHIFVSVFLGSKLGSGISESKRK